MMRRWLYDNPWIWIVLLLAALMAASVATLIIAEANKPELVSRLAPGTVTTERAERGANRWR